MAKELAVQDAMIVWLRENGATFIKTHGSSIRSGEPDLVASLSPWGFTLVVEVKKPGGVASPQQLIRLQQWRRSGAIALLLDNVAELGPTVTAAIEEKKRGIIQDNQRGPEPEEQGRDI